MNNSFLVDYRIWITAFLSSGLGILFITISSFFDKKPLLLAAWPLSVFFLVFLVIQPKWTATIILLLRPLLDVLLNLTKVNVGGEGVGVGFLLNLIVILLVVFLAFYTFNSSGKGFPINYWVAFLGVMLFSALYTPYHKDALRLCFDYLSYFAMYLIPFLIIKNEEDFIYWLKILGLSFVLPVLFANYDLLRGGQYFEDSGMRIAGTFTHPNILAFYLVLAFTFYFYILKSGLIKANPFASTIIKVLMVDMLILLVATKTRNAWVALYIGSIIYGLLKDKLLLGFLIVVVPLMLFIPEVHNRVGELWGNDTINDYHGVNSWEWRLQLWTVSLSKILERPILGFGLASFKPSTEVFFPSAAGMHAHNAYLEILFETGIVGLVCFISLFINPIFIFVKKMRVAVNKTQACIWAIIVAYIISYMIICSADNLSYYLTFNWYVWFFIGLMLVASYRNYQVNSK